MKITMTVQQSAILRSVLELETSPSLSGHLKMEKEQFITIHSLNMILYELQNIVV